MTFEQEIKAIDELALSFRNREQANILLAEEVMSLKQEKSALTATLESLVTVAKRDEDELYRTRDALMTETRNNGELKAMLKQLLAEQMALASRAAEMLRSLEEKPEPIIGKEEIKIEKPTSASDLKDAQFKDHEVRLLEHHVSKTLNDISTVAEGRTFTIDAPYGERITDWILKRWYRRIIGKPPVNYKEAPSIRLRKKDGGAWEYLGQAPKLVNSTQEESTITEDRKPLPFRTETTKLEGNEGTPPAFSDDGAHIPDFLAKGPAYNGIDHADKGREPRDT